MALKIVYDEVYETHIIWPGHPESPERLLAIKAWLQDKQCFTYDAPLKVTKADLCLAHDEEYVRFIEEFEGTIDADTYVHRGKTYNVALAAVGGALKALDLAMNSTPSFALVRPPGHHAGITYGGGFCYFNNVAIAARKAQSLGKVAIVDIDAHHGNGTSDIFFECADVLYISLHEWGIYPGTGRLDDVGTRKGQGFTVNVPLKHGSGDASYIAAFDEVVLPILYDYKPALILVSMGGDAHYMDPLTTLSLSTPGYKKLGEKLLAAASEICKNRIMFVLEGGYHLDALAEVVGSIILQETRTAGTNQAGAKYMFTEIYDDKCRSRRVINTVKKIHSDYWQL